jgi:hypothetical protein
MSKVSAEDLPEG